MSIVKEINHNAGGTVGTYYTKSITDPDGRASIAAAAGLSSTAAGLALSHPALGGSTVLKEGVTITGTDARLKAEYDPNSTGAPASNRDYYVVAAVSGIAVAGFALRAKTDGSFAVIGIYETGSGQTLTSEFAISDAPHCVECDFIDATVPFASDGIYRLYIDGTQQFEITTLSTNGYTVTINEISVSVNAVETGQSGSVYIDEIILDNDTTAPLYCSAGGAFRFLGFDADNGTLLVTGLKSAATLQLFEYSDLATLAESGTTSFGSATDTELDNLTRGIFPVVRPEGDGRWYLYGRDGNNVQAQYNDTNGTLGWVDIGPGTATWGTAKYAVALMPAPTQPNDVIIAFQDDDIYRARYGTAVWVKMGDATSGLRTAVRHPVRFNELLAGGTAAGTVWYSHNFGVSWTDVGGTAMGTINAFEVSL